MGDGEGKLRFSLELLHKTLYLRLVDSYCHLRRNIFPPIKFQRRRPRISAVCLTLRSYSSTTKIAMSAIEPINVTLSCFRLFLLSRSVISGSY